MNVSAKAKWKTVPMDAQLRARGFAEGLLGIEELNSYDLVKIGKRKAKNEKVTKIEDAKIVKKGKKRPLKEVNEETKIEEPEKKKKKSKQKRKPKEKKKKAKIVIDEEDDESHNEERTDDSPIISAETENVELTGWKDYNISKPILRALKELKFEEPTPIQRETLPAALNGRADILGAAETGSGKTLAFGIPIINGILNDADISASNEMEEEESSGEMENEDEEIENQEGEMEESSEEEEDMENPEADSGCVRVLNNVDFDFEVDIDEEVPTFIGKKKRKVKAGKLKALILTPTRELAIQIKNHIEAIAKYTSIKIVPIVGGMSVQKQIRLLDQAPEVVVATPGRLWDLIREGHPNLGNMEDLKYLAIDETDRMVEKGHFEELQNLLEMVNENEAKKKQRQTFVFSATLSLVHDLPKHLSNKKGAKKMTPEDKLKRLMEMIGVKARPKIADLTRKIGTAETLTESKIHCSNTEKDFYLYYFLQQHPGRSIVFCNSIDCVRRLLTLFGLLSTEPLGLHAQMHQKQRLKNLERFAANENGFLIATDVAARGLDIPNVEHVVHYQVPRTSESYIHRSGRTARAKKEGVSVVLIDPSETQFYRRMCKTLNRDEDLALFPIDSQVLGAVKVRVSLARTLDKLMLDKRKEDVEKSWKKKMAEEAEIEISDEEDNDFDQTKSQKRAQIDGKIKATRAQLNTLLATPMHTQSFAGKYPTMSGKLQLPTEFKVRQEDSAVKAVSKSKAEMKALLRGSNNAVKSKPIKMKQSKRKKKNKSMTN